MMRRFISYVVTCLCMAISAHADIQADARKIQETHQDAVVYLKAVLEIDRGGQKRESSLETLGTFISDSGLIVTANSNLGQTPNSEGNAPTLQDLKVLMPDGAELPGTLVMQDTDLDLAFIKVSREGDAGSFPNVTLQEQGPKFELFDQYVTLGRQEEDLQRQSSLSIGRVSAVVKRPRLLYGASQGSYGAPAFNAAGELVGIFVRKIHKGRNGSLIILPTKSIHKVAQQIPGPEEEKTGDQEEDAADDEVSDEPAKEDPEAPKVESQS